MQYVSAPGYQPHKLGLRNRCMIDRAQAVIAAWDGGQSGGTWRAIGYAHYLQRPIFAINPTTGTAAWLQPPGHAPDVAAPSCISR